MERTTPLSVFWSFYCMYSQTLQLCAHIRKSHPTRVIQYIFTHLMAPLEALVPITNYNLSPRVSKPAFVCNLLWVYKRTCISIYKYMHLFIYLFIYSRRACDALNMYCEATWTGGIGLLCFSSLPRGSPEDLLSIQAAPCFGVWKNMWHYIFNERLGLGFILIVGLAFRRPTGLAKRVLPSDPLNVSYLNLRRYYFRVFFRFPSFLYCALSGNAWVMRLFITVRKFKFFSKALLYANGNAAQKKVTPFPSRYSLPGIVSRYIRMVYSAKPGSWSGRTRSPKFSDR